MIHAPDKIKTRPALLPQLSPGNVRWQNRMHSKISHGLLMLGGEEWQVRPIARPKSTLWNFRAYGSWGRCETLLFLSHALPLDWLDVKMDTARLENVAQELLGAACEALLEEVLDSLEKASGRPVTVNSVRLGEENVDGLDEALFFRLERVKDGYHVEGTLALTGETNEAEEVLARLFETKGFAAEQTGWTKALPLRLKVEVGEVKLSLRELFSVEPGDIIVPDLYHPSRNNTVIIRIENGPALRGTMNRNNISVQEYLMSTELDERKVSTAPGSATGKTDLKNLEVPLRLELETLTLSVEQLESIQPGYVLETAKSLDAPIELSVNGKTIGTGELVDIGGKAGVRVLTIGMENGGE